MNKIKMSAGLLDLIIMVQTHKQLIIRESIFHNEHGTKIKKDWRKDTEKYYNNIDSNILKQYGLSKNIASYEKVISYKVTPKMTATEIHHLDKFEF